jgi:hypothetical protein
MRYKSKIFYAVEIDGYWWVPKMHKFMMSQDIPKEYGFSNVRHLKTRRKAFKVFHNSPSGALLSIFVRKEKIHKWMVSEWVKV